MKRLILILICFSGLLSSNAQRLTEPNYGLIVNANFSTIGSSMNQYAGIALGSVGVFFQNPLSPYHSNRYVNRLDYTIEAAISASGFRDRTSDKQFRSRYADLSFYMNYVPDRMSDDLRLMIGIRPSYLTYTSTRILSNGSYQEVTNDSQNLNSVGRVDFSAIAGLCLNMGSVASLELKYVHSFTNMSNALYYQGKPSMLEVGLRMSANRVKDHFSSKDQQLQAELNRRAQGTLLVMLEQPDEALIAQLLQDKRISDADYIRNLQRQTNLNIIQEFKSNFDFCKVLFFMSGSAQKVNKMDWDSVFVDEFLHPVSVPGFDSSNYFIASFAEDISNITNRPDYGLYFYNEHFIQLGKPYNTNANSMGIFVGGDPMNYFRRVKTSGYFPEDFRKILRKANSRLQLGRINLN